MGEREGAVGGAISLELQAVLDSQKDSILQAVNAQFSGLKSSLLQQQADLTTQFASKVEAAEKYTFKKKGNEQQFKLNQKVGKRSERALKALESGNADKVKEELKKGILLLKERQKLIKLADKSEFGWSTINEYVDDELAANEVDAKKIKKAEKRAADKLKSVQEKSKKAQKPHSANLARGNSFSNAGFTAHNWRYFCTQSGRYFGDRQFDSCFRCGRRGHWASACSRPK